MLIWSCVWEVRTNRFQHTIVLATADQLWIEGFGESEGEILAIQKYRENRQTIMMTVTSAWLTFSKLKDRLTLVYPSKPASPGSNPLQSEETVAYHSEVDTLWMNSVIVGIRMIHLISIANKTLMTRREIKISQNQRQNFLNHLLKS